MIASCTLEKSDSDSSMTDRRTKLEGTHSPASVTSTMMFAEKNQSLNDGKVPFLDTTGSNACSSTDPCTKAGVDNDESADNNGASRSVRFCRTITVRRTRSCLDYTRRQIKACWYQRWEIDEIRSNCAKDLQRWSKRCNGENDNDKDETETDDEPCCCLRGLESYEPLAKKRKRRLRTKAAFAVFDIEDGGGDDAAIAAYYSAVTSRCQILANVVGLRDQREAESFYIENENENEVGLVDDQETNNPMA